MALKGQTSPPTANVWRLLMVVTACILRPLIQTNHIDMGIITVDFAGCLSWIQQLAFNKGNTRNEGTPENPISRRY
jgi:hypothetical protein